MIYIINEEISERKGLDLPSLLMLMLVKTGVNINELTDKLVNDEMLVKSESSGDYFITCRWDNVVNDILLSADPKVPSEDSILDLATKLMNLFPAGKKDGTPYYWKGNKKDIKEKLQKFYKLYGQKYTEEQILTAAESYVKSFNGNYKFMRLLKYFIWKADKKINEEGSYYVEEVSELATYIENAGQETQNEDWQITLK